MEIESQRGGGLGLEMAARVPHPTDTDNTESSRDRALTTTPSGSANSIHAFFIGPPKRSSVCLLIQAVSSCGLGSPVGDQLLVPLFSSGRGRNALMESPI